LLTGCCILKKLLIIFIIGSTLLSSFVSANSLINDELMENHIRQNLKSNGYINITALEAWDLMNNSDDGRQIPIDIRRWE